MNQFKTFVCSSVSLIVCFSYIPFQWCDHFSANVTLPLCLQTYLFFIKRRLCKRKKCLRCKCNCGACHNALCSTLPHCLHTFKDLGIMVCSNLNMPNEMSFYWTLGSFRCWLVFCNILYEINGCILISFGMFTSCNNHFCLV